MKSAIVARSGFFAFLAVVLIGVCIALFLNMPPEASAASNYDPNGASAADADYTPAEPADAPAPVDAKVQPAGADDAPTAS